MRPVPVVVVEPLREVGLPFHRALVDVGVGPFIEQGADEAFHLPIDSSCNLPTRCSLEPRTLVPVKEWLLARGEGP